MNPMATKKIDQIHVHVTYKIIQKKMEKKDIKQNKKRN